MNKNDYLKKLKVFDDLSDDPRKASLMFDKMMKDFYKSVIGEKENPYSYEHELAVQKTLCRVVGEN